MDENEEKPKKSKGVGAVLVFLILGLILSTFINYSQTSTIQYNTAERAVIGDEILQNSRNNADKLDKLIQQMSDLQNKMDALEKAGKTVK